MKQVIKRAAALALALVIGVTPFASASDAMGREVQGSTTQLSEGTSLTKQIFWSDTYADLRTERYFTYMPNRNVTPTVVFGGKVLDKATLTAMAQQLESQGRRVIGGINGDLYVLATGAPLGMVVTDGMARSVPSSDNFSYHAVGFRSDGTAFVGQPKLTPTVTFKGFTFPLGGGINKVRNVATNYVLLTEDFAATTQNSEPGIDVILTPVLDSVGQSVELDLDVHNYGGAAKDPSMISEVKTTVTQGKGPAVGGRVTYQVEQVLYSTGPVAIPEGKAVLSINNKSSAYFLDYMKLLQPGDRVDVDITTEEQAWNEADQAMGGLYRLVTNGQINSGLPAERTAYTAVGVKADGTAVFYTVDGKQPGYSVGATLTQVAMRLVELGCVDAVSLDGGGSTTIGATYPDGSNLGVLNKPSDGGQRSNSVAVFLTTGLKPTGQLSSIYVTPNDRFLLSGAKVNLTAKGLDSSYYTMDLGGTPTWSVQNGDGTVSSDGVFTAGGSSGTTQVVATYGSATGNTSFTVTNNPDKVYLANPTTGQAVTSLSLDPGAKVDLTASAAYKGIDLVSQDNCFTWLVDASVGTIDQDGVLTAASKSGSGNLAVSVGGVSVTIPVSVAGHVNTLESFERGISSVTASGGTTLALEQNSDQVRYGSSSLKVSYDVAQSGAASLTSTLSIPAGEKSLNLWVYGDGSPNSLTATFADAQGATSEVLLTGLDAIGWKYVTASIPDGAIALRSLNLLLGGADKSAGTIWLDQLTTSNEPVWDELPPVVTLSHSGQQLTATITDAMDKSFTAAQVNVSYDGVALVSSFDPASNTVKATLPISDGRLHRVAVTATDASGNIGRGTLTIEAVGGQASVFRDTGGHWAETYANYLYARNVTTGVPGAVAGQLLFQPDKAITRGELFAMAGRFLGLDFNQYADTVLPFVDAWQIPDWALSSVKAMYALGYLKGSSAGDGSVYANVNANITRAEAMTILGRMQAKGYAQGDLSAFVDGWQVSDWAAPYVKTMVGQGIVSGGTDSLIRPADPIKRGEVAKILFSMTGS